jgi:hypothetical protein
MRVACVHCGRDRTDVHSAFFQPWTCCVPSLDPPAPLIAEDVWRGWGAALARAMRPLTRRA